MPEEADEADDDHLFPAAGWWEDSYISSDLRYELRITERCLREDLYGAETTPLRELADRHEIVEALLKERSSCPEPEAGRMISGLGMPQRVYVLARGHDHRAGTWYDAENRVVWMLACGRHRSGQPGDFFPYARELGSADELLPTEADYDRLLEERDLRAARDFELRVRAARERARTNGQTSMGLSGGREVRLRIEIVEDIEQISLTADMRALRGGELWALMALLGPPSEWHQHPPDTPAAEITFELLTEISAPKEASEHV